MENFCNAYINPSARINDFLTVCAILHGVEKEVNIVADNPSYEVVSLKPGLGVKISSKNIDANGFSPYFDGFITVNIKSFSALHQQFSLQMLYNNQGQTLYRSILSPNHVALAIKLITIFGGRMTIERENKSILFKDIGIFNNLLTADENETFRNKQLFFKELNSLTTEEIIKANSLLDKPLKELDLNSMLNHYKSYEILNFSQKLENSLKYKTVSDFKHIFKI